MHRLLLPKAQNSEQRARNPIDRERQQEHSQHWCSILPPNEFSRSNYNFNLIVAKITQPAHGHVVMVVLLNIDNSQVLEAQLFWV